MKKHAPLAAFILTALITPFIASAAWSADRGRITFLVGDVRISRKGRPVNAAVAAVLNEGDVIRLGNDSMVKISLGGGEETLSITGPIVFIYHAASLKKSVEKGNALWRIAAKMSRNTPHYYPRTIVSAVRGREDRDRAEKERISKLMKEAIDEYRNGDSDRAWADFEQLNGSKLLNRHGRALVSFYRAGILFDRGNFEKAIDIYSEVSNEKVPGFKFNEESLARAYLCALYIGERDRAAQIHREYLKRFGADGAFRETMEIQP